MAANPFARLFGARQTLDDEDERRQEKSWAELKAGRLPLSAQERLASQAADAVFTSALSTRELAALRAAGYEPVGQAFGTATFRLTRLTYAGYQIHPSSYLGSSRNSTLRINPVMIGAYHDGERQARSKAMARMTAECRALAGDGVIGIRISQSSPQRDLYEFTMIGTVVRLEHGAVNGPGRTKEPFLTTLSAADVGQLAVAGWRPVRLLYELQRFAGHGGYVGFGAGRLNPTNYQVGEIAAATTVLEFGRSRIRQLLNAGLTARSGMVMDVLRGEVEREECTAIDGQSDFVVDILAVGTAIEPVPFTGTRPARKGLDIMPVLRLDDAGERP